MYEIIKDGTHIALQDEVVYVLKNRNNIYIPCEPVKAEGVVMGNDYVEPIEGLEIFWMDGVSKINRMNTAGAEAIKALKADPPANAGVFTYDEWQADTFYEQYDVFTHNGNAYFAKQDLTSSSVYPPDALGVEALYGVRPTPDSDGVYPYIQNMAVVIDMKVRSAKDNEVYICYANATDTLIYDPADVPAIFNKL